jgi:hypothetical protein
MLSIGLWRRHIHITVIVLNIIHRPAFYLKHDVSESAFYLRLQVEHTQIGAIHTASVSIRLALTLILFVRL